MSCCTAFTVRAAGAVSLEDSSPGHAAASWKAAYSSMCKELLMDEGRHAGVKDPAGMNIRGRWNSKQSLVHNPQTRA